MHLKQLKLAGFKSFVDPTIVPFPSQLAAVVGPNGCGKSNIIDAVRWVMGESSAKNLRGESMTDVIFNGSSQRKALGQASVELTFDNSLGRLTGQYASYQEIAVKRVVSRDGESAYFLNGSRCRRRDITDIFLGTGAGARGYSIIGQGTISRIIEARPEELRTYFEEASGISKYKERRRETLSRIEHTRENLTRVADIRNELEKQLQRLERQAKTAERFKSLKAKEHLCKTEILALKWQALTQEQQKKQHELMQLVQAYEEHLANAANAYKQSTNLREKRHDENDSFQQVQASFYQLATEIARLEEGLQQHQREKMRLESDQQQMQNDWQNANSQLKQNKESLASSEILLIELQKNLELEQNQFNLKQKDLELQQEQQASWLGKTQELQAAFSKALREAQVLQLRLQNLSENRQQTLVRFEKINNELAFIATASLSEALDNQQNLLKTLQIKTKSAEDLHQQLSTDASLVRQQLSETEKLLHQAQDEVHRLHTQQAGLKAAQQAAFGLDANQKENLAHWANHPRLVETLKVEKSWQLACEFVLAEGLQAIVLDSLGTLWPDLAKLQGSSAGFMSYAQSAEINEVHTSLAAKIKSPKPSCLPCLDKIYTASSLEEALALQPRLNADESVITADGHWLGKDWVKIAGTTTNGSLIVQQEELTAIKVALSAAADELVILKIKRDELHEQVKDKDQAHELAKQQLSENRENFRACEAELNQKDLALKHAETRKNSLIAESEELRIKLEELVEQQENAEQQCKRASDEAKLREQEQGLLAREKAKWDQSLAQSRMALEETRTAFHQSQLEFDRKTLTIQQLKNNLEREDLHLITLSARLENLAQRLIELEEPDHALKASLDEKIGQQAELEKILSRGQEQLNNLANQLESWESLIKSEEKFAKTVQEKIQQEQMQEQALALRAGGILETLTELNAEVEVILAAIPAEVNQGLREAEIEEFGNKIKQLGAINLAAIEEYDGEFQRKQHLDEQYQDLTEALTTLDTAIEKMDKETHQRLKTTFDKVNIAFQSLFPRLFGGGRAMLELTCDNLLEAGVVVMAQPPGKRNSTIHLLSGGEKAMTAVALVFAIFQLNPSPFCMLDEVDAPLDDVNVRRFCDLVKEMSQFVQFLFITHNKVTMELASHLIGVTMREPGVSRIVAVDVEEALAMAKA
ncbi:MAG: chromosome segregation protein SMC [Tatlockia sp.]|nr:chromosome segregation protein SMC [Tatlockia sp.]